MQKFEAVTFDYGSLDEWKRYFEEIKELAKSCKIIEEFWNELKRRCDGLTFKDLQEEFDYSTVLLGGVTPDGEYKERSLARVYAVLFGFKPENIHDLIEKLKRGLPPTTKIVVEETEFIRFVKSVSDKVMSILRQAESKGLIDSADVDVEIDYFGILSDYKKLIEIVENFVNNVAKILPNYNQKSLFVWTLTKLTYRYMTTAYPELRDERVFEVVMDVLGLNVVFSPEVEDERVKREYEVYSYYDSSIGGELCKLFQMIWYALADENFRKHLQVVFTELRNPYMEFYKLVIQSLKSIGWRFPNIEFTQRYYDSSFVHRYQISGIILTSQHAYYTGQRYPVVETKNCNISLLKLLDDLAPGVFLLNGLLFILEISKDYFEIIALSPGYAGEINRLKRGE